MCLSLCGWREPTLKRAGRSSIEAASRSLLRIPSQMPQRRLSLYRDTRPSWRKQEDNVSILIDEKTPILVQGITGTKAASIPRR